MPQQIGNPFCIHDIRLPPRHLLDMTCIDQQHLKVLFQDVVDRLPVFPRAFHRHVGDPETQQPIRQPQQVSRHGPKGPNFLPQPTLPIRNNDRSNYSLLVNVQSSTMCVFDLHANLASSKFRLAWIPDQLESNLRASFTERQLAVPTGIPVRLNIELGAPLRKRPVCQPVAARYSTFSCLAV